VKGGLATRWGAEVVPIERPFVMGLERRRAIGIDTNMSCHGTIKRCDKVQEV
jgi:hypothetical protein